MREDMKNSIRNGAWSNLRRDSNRKTNTIHMRANGRHQLRGGYARQFQNFILIRSNAWDTLSNHQTTQAQTNWRGVFETTLNTRRPCLRKNSTRLLHVHRKRDWSRKRKVADQRLLMARKQNGSRLCQKERLKKTSHLIFLYTDKKKIYINKEKLPDKRLKW